MNLLDEKSTLNRKVAVLEARSVNFKAEAQKAQQPTVKVVETFTLEETARILRMDEDVLLEQLIEKKIICKGDPCAQKTYVNKGYFTRCYKKVWIGCRREGAEVSEVTHAGLLYLAKIIER